MQIKLSGGGGWAPIVQLVTGAVESTVKSQVPQTVDPQVCPVVDKLALRVNQCGDAAALGPTELLLCVLTGKSPVCTTPPCYGCDSIIGKCSEVPAGTNGSTPSQPDCALACVPPPSPPHCISDGDCTDAGLGHSCCSGRKHATAKCKYGRCGCIAKGDCADNTNDCCSGKGHKTAKCSLGVGYRCD